MHDHYILKHFTIGVIFLLLLQIATKKYVILRHKQEVVRNNQFYVEVPT